MVRARLLQPLDFRAQLLQPLGFVEEETEGQRGPVPCSRCHGSLLMDVD